MAKPDKYFMGSGRDYPKKNVMIEDYTNPRFALSEFRMWLSEALSFKCESTYAEGMLSVWGTKQEEYVSHMKDWLTKNSVPYTLSTAIEYKFGVNDTDKYKTKVVKMQFSV